MCGIIGGIANGNIAPTLIQSLKRLEYRGYDSSGVVVLTNQKTLARARSVGRVKNLEKNIQQRKTKIIGSLGLAHTRWATHGAPSAKNAHPHICDRKVSVVHNGIIENFSALKAQQQSAGYRFTSDTDTEVIAHAIHAELQNSRSLVQAVGRAVKTFAGAYSIGVIGVDYPRELIIARRGSPLVIGIGKEGKYIASDPVALVGVGARFIFLEDGDIARISDREIQIYDHSGKRVERADKILKIDKSGVALAGYQTFMQKEIFEQPRAIQDTLESRITEKSIVSSAFGNDAERIFKTIRQIQIVACGTSYHAALVGKYWLEDIAKIPTHVEVASEYRYRNPVILNDTLFIAISQSGETADTLEALRMVKKTSKKMHTLCICNAPESTLQRESERVFLTHAGPEIGVASTKAFTTQLVSLALFCVVIGKSQKNITPEQESRIVSGLRRLPNLIEKTLKKEPEIKTLAKKLATKFNVLFLGRGVMHPIAMEGALKLKEISYIHAEAYPAGELKHGPIALIDKNTPVIAVAPNDQLLDKLKSNLAAVKSRGSDMVVFEDEASNIEAGAGLQIIRAAKNLGRITAPIIFTVPLQLLSYHVALTKGTDIDKPRNLAKSVTVE